MTIKIHDRDVELKYSFRALMIYENIQNKTFAPQSMTDVLVFFFSVIIASDKDAHLSFDEFLDMIDEKPSLVADFSEWLTNEFNQNSMLESKDEDESKKKLSKPTKKQQ